jgi:hypothetical protein
MVCIDGADFPPSQFAPQHEIAGNAEEDIPCYPNGSAHGLPGWTLGSLDNRRETIHDL